MTKYAVSIKGAESLRDLGRTLLANSNSLVEAGDSLIQRVSVLGDRLGPYEDSVVAIVKQNSRALFSCKEDIVYLSENACKQADEIMALLELSSGGQSHTDRTCGKPVADEKPMIAANLVADGYCKHADFGLLDSRTAADMAAAVRETVDDFPELKLCFIGSLQSRNKSIEADFMQMYLNAYRRAYPGAADEDLMPYVEKHLREDKKTRLKGFEARPGTIAQSLFVGHYSGHQDDLIASYNGITVNERYGGDYDYFTKVKESDVMSGWKPENTATPKATMDHELGHQIAKLTRAHDDQEIISLFSRFDSLSEDGKARVLSGYAGTNIHEFIAEAWSEYRNNAYCRDCAKAVSERMIALYNGLHSNTKRRILK